jgi:hypothetical protein
MRLVYAAILPAFFPCASSSFKSLPYNPIATRSRLPVDRSLAAPRCSKPYPAPQSCRRTSEPRRPHAKCLLVSPVSTASPVHVQCPSGQLALGSVPSAAQASIPTRYGSSFLMIYQLVSYPHWGFTMSVPCSESNCGFMS